MYLKYVRSFGFSHSPFLINRRRVACVCVCVRACTLAQPFGLKLFLRFSFSRDDRDALRWGQNESTNTKFPINLIDDNRFTYGHWNQKLIRTKQKKNDSYFWLDLSRAAQATVAMSRVKIKIEIENWCISKCFLFIRVDFIPAVSLSLSLRLAFDVCALTRACLYSYRSKGMRNDFVAFVFVFWVTRQRHTAVESDHRRWRCQKVNAMTAHTSEEQTWIRQKQLQAMMNVVKQGTEQHSKRNEREMNKEKIMKRTIVAMELEFLFFGSYIFASSSSSSSSSSSCCSFHVNCAAWKYPKQRNRTWNRNERWNWILCVVVCRRQLSAEWK